MIDIESLEEKFSIEGELGFTEIDGDLIAISVYNKFADAEICLYGGHITRFVPHGSFDILWLSPASFFEIGKPIRGGIPICFPWFGPHPTDNLKPMHGFARLMYWDVVETASIPSGETLIKLQLCSSVETKQYWPSEFKAELTIVVGKKLDVQLAISNTGTEPFEYTAALHSYLSVSDIASVKIEGLQGVSYYEGVGNQTVEQTDEFLEILQEENRRYIDTEADCIIHDDAFGHGIRVSKTGSKVTVVWNPGAETSSKMSDLEPDSYETFVCVEAVNSYNNSIRLGKDETHVTSTTIGLDYGLKDAKPGASGGFVVVP